jgi:hypothetical protein
MQRRPPHCRRVCPTGHGGAGPHARRVAASVAFATALAGFSGLAAPPAFAQAHGTLSEDVRQFVSVAACASSTAPAARRGRPDRRHGERTHSRGRPARAGAVPAGARVLELPGHTVIPGIVGMHNHTFYTTAAGRQHAAQLQRAPSLPGHRRHHRAHDRQHAPYSEINMKRAIDRRSAGPAHAHHRAVPDRSEQRLHDRRCDAGGRAPHRRYWVEEGVTGSRRTPHQPRRAGRRDRGGAPPGREVHRPPLLGVLPRGRRARHRQPRARPLHQQRLRAEPRSRTSARRACATACSTSTSTVPKCRPRSAT